MPGWDRKSVGYHGDDGNFFHGSGRGSQFHRRFGLGDTIGVGLIQLDQNTTLLFFTLNGTLFHSSKFITVRDDARQKPALYPVVALDHPSLALVVNFGTGNRSFLFDDPLTHGALHSYITNYNKLNSSITKFIRRHFYTPLQHDDITIRRRARTIVDAMPFINYSSNDEEDDDD